MGLLSKSPNKGLERLPDGRAFKSVEDLGGWGRVPRAAARLIRPERWRDLTPPEGQLLARGLGRSYGDAALLSGGTTILTERLDRCLEFDPDTGRLTAEAGLSLNTLLDVFVPKGWFVPVTPGTRFCTLGGCFAADVHGKNHHRDGSFAQWVTQITLILPSGETRVCQPEGENQDLFWATAGGMGLTGIIRDLTLQLRPIETAYISVKHRKARNLDEALSLLADDALDDAYSVAWIDCLARGDRLGRSILMTGHHATRGEIPLRISDPLNPKPPKAKKIKRDLPAALLNPFTIRLFNAAYYAYQGRKTEFVADYRTFFHPLDAIQNWNRMYGAPGFYQYQFVVPAETARECLKDVLSELSKAGAASFLAVLKRMGPSSPGWLSFPAPGFTLALDVPNRPGIADLLRRLDERVLAAGGRIYLAKDALLTPASVRAMYPRLPEFLALKAELDPDNRLTSDLARRLELTPSGGQE